MSASRLDPLKQQIKAAFADALKPEDDRIGYDPHDWESVELTNAFKGKHWKDIPPEDLQHNSSSFLSTESFRYYLPAYLLAALDDYGNLLQHTVFGLGPPHESTSRAEEVWAWQLERFEGLSAAQKRAVRAFLEYARDECTYAFVEAEAPRLALEKYWGQQ